MQILSTIKSFYVTVFSFIIDKLKKIINWNKGIILGIKDDFTNKDYLKVGLKSLGYVFLFCLQVSLFILVLVSYIACKLTGICLVI